MYSSIVRRNITLSYLSLTGFNVRYLNFQSLKGQLVNSSVRNCFHVCCPIPKIHENLRLYKYVLIKRQFGGKLNT